MLSRPGLLRLGNYSLLVGDLELYSLIDGVGPVGLFVNERAGLSPVGHLDAIGADSELQDLFSYGLGPTESELHVVFLIPM